MADLPDLDEAARVGWFVHAVQHTWACTGHPAAHLTEPAMVHDCWDAPIEEPPGWAIEAAAAGKPAATWCPILTPTLRNTP